MLIAWHGMLERWAEWKNNPKMWRTRPHQAGSGRGRVSDINGAPEDDHVHRLMILEVGMADPCNGVIMVRVA